MTILRRRETDIEALDHTFNNAGLVNGRPPVAHDWQSDPFPDLEPRPSTSFRRPLEIEDIVNPLVNSQPHIRTYYGPVAPPRPYTEEERQANPDRPPLEPPGGDTDDVSDSDEAEPKAPSVINQMDLIEDNPPVRPDKNPIFRRFGKWIKEKLKAGPKFGNFVRRIWSFIIAPVYCIMSFFRRTYNGLARVFL
ncbi:hypothetical protein BZA77DRAFT_353153 [Pyronema omphalodes]|nr:hypothetical protein BZA77DRAFT_353153 [Pyronema omphalodes]